MTDYDTDDTDLYTEPDGPDPDDWVTTDHVVFREHETGRVRVRVGDGEDVWAALEREMARVKFWPNVWFVSDHGNAHLMTK